MRLQPLICSLFALLTTGCSVLQTQAPAPQLVWSSQAAPAVSDAVHSAAVAERMLLAGNVNQGPGLRSVANNVLCENASKRILMPLGREFVLSTTKEGAQVYCGKLIWENKYAGKERTEIDECLARDDGRQWSLYFNHENCPESVAVEPVTYVAPSESNQQQEITYTGSSGTQVFLRYREFANDVNAARTSQEVRFDLADSPIVGLKGAQFEVLKADNLHIEYRVLKVFADASSETGPAPAQ